ncbi:MAG: S4 domain-containing protein, partial [Pseudomonadota bacterium]|nr:S4 domain-containing protein [Pseudomonadota bacterium]
MSNLDFSEVVYVKVSGQYDGQRLDNFLIRILKNVPKSRIYNLIRKGEIRINKGRCKADSRLAMDDIIRIPPIKSIRNNENPVVSNSLKKYISENILFEDKDLLVFNKPSGLAVHGGSGISMGVI